MVLEPFAQHNEHFLGKKYCTTSYQHICISLQSEHFYGNLSFDWKIDQTIMDLNEIYNKAS